jgi:sugar phosphate isomerase/epimerase
MKISICNELFKGWEIEKTFDYAAQLGYDGVELAPFTMGATALDISAPKEKVFAQRLRGQASRSSDSIGCW